MNHLLEVLQRVTRAAAHGLVRSWYPRIHVTGAEHLPAKGPVLIAANHPNSLLDAMVLEIAVKRDLRFIASSPLFRIPALGLLLRWWGMIEGHCACEGWRHVKQNTGSVELAAGALVQGHAVGIFPEGKTHDGLRFERTGSGAARIAHAAMMRGAAVLIVPVGLHYENKERFGSGVWVNVGEPLDAGRWLQGANTRGAQVMRRLTGELSRRLQAVSPHLDDPAWEDWLPDIETVAPQQGAGDQPALAALLHRKACMDFVNHLVTEHREDAHLLAKALTAHRERLHRAGLPATSPWIHLCACQIWLCLGLEVGWLAFWALPALAGTVFHFLPCRTARFLAGRLPQVGRTTAALTTLVVGVPIMGLWYGLVIALAVTEQSWVGATVVALMPGCEWLARAWRERAMGWRTLWHERQAARHADDLDNLRDAHAQLQSRVMRLFANARQRN